MENTSKPVGRDGTRASFEKAFAEAQHIRAARALQIRLVAFVEVKPVLWQGVDLPLKGGEGERRSA